MSSGKKTSPKKKAGNGQKGSRKNKQSPNIMLPQAPAIAYGKPIVNRGPMIRSNEKFCMITHREPLGVIDRSAVPFIVKIFSAINPGLASTFKWLSNQAIGWEKYVFEKLEFEYVTRTSTLDAGSIMLAVDHDAADAPPASEDILESYAHCKSDSVWVRSMSIKAICDNTKRFIRSEPLAANLDIKTYDLGNFIAATSGLTGAGGNLGKCYVSYTVKFYIPQLPSNFAPQAGGTITSGGTVGQANPFGTAPTLSPLARGVDVVGSSRLNFQNIGQYLVSMTGTGAGLVNLQNPTIFSGAGSVTDSGSVTNSAATTSVLKSIINTTVPNTVVDWTFTGSPGFASSHTDIARGPTGALV